MLAERQTDRQTDTVITILRSPIGGCGVIITYNRYDRISKAELNTYYSDRPAGLSRNAKRKGKKHRNFRNCPLPHYRIQRH